LEVPKVRGSVPVISSTTTLLRDKWLFICFLTTGEKVKKTGFQLMQFKANKKNDMNWLVVSTHLKNMFVKFSNLPQFSG